MISIQICAENEICGETTKAKLSTGNETPVSISDEKVQAKQGQIYFYHLYLFLSTKNSLFTSDINYLKKGINFKSVIL